MLNLIAGILILIIVALALGKSLLASHASGVPSEDEEYPDDPEDAEYPELPADGGRRAHERAAPMVDDFVLQDAVDEEHDLTGVWEDEEP